MEQAHRIRRDLVYRLAKAGSSYKEIANIIRRTPTRARQIFEDEVDRRNMASHSTRQHGTVVGIMDPDIVSREWEDLIAYQGGL